MKIINIFLASSIDEFKNERNELQCFINDVAEDFRDRYDTDIRVQRCEKVDPRYVKGRSQDEFNELIKNSEMCIFLFFTKAGEYTIEEFEVARKAFEVSENGKPKIYTYFKTIDDVSVEKSVTDFMSELDKNLKHFYQTFSHIDTVKLRVLLNLKMQEMDFISIEFDDGKCIVDGKETLDLSNVAEFANNGVLKQLNEEFLSIDKEYCEMKPIYATGKTDEAFCKKYAEIAARRQNLLDTIEELQKNIFNISLRMCEDDVHGEITSRQKKAYRLFELGDLEGANNILDFDEISNDYQRRKEIRKQEQIKETRIFVRESITKIEVLTAMTNYKGRFDDIEKIYDAIVPEVLEYNIEIEVLYDYSSYLEEQGKSQKAYNIAIKLIDICENFSCCDARTKARYYNLIGTICNNLNDVEEAENKYITAIKIYEQLAKDNLQNYNFELAVLYNNIEVLYRDQDDLEKSIKYHNLTMIHYEQLAKENRVEYDDLFGVFYGNFGSFYAFQDYFDKAEEFYITSIEYLEQLAREKPEKHNNNLAIAYNNIGCVYHKSKNYAKAKKYYFKSIKIREKLAEDNPFRYIYKLAESYNNIAKLYSDQDYYIEAERYYFEAIKILEQLVKYNSDRYNFDLAESYDGIALLCDKQNQFENTEMYYLKAIDIREQLVKKSPNKHNSYLARSYSNIAAFYHENKHNKKAENYYLKAIVIREKLIKENSKKYNSALALNYYNYAVLKNGDIIYYMKAHVLALNQPEEPNCNQILENLKHIFY